MPQAQTMTLDEKLAISCKAAELWDAGDKEGYDRLMKTAPMSPLFGKSSQRKNRRRFFYKWRLEFVGSGG